MTDTETLRRILEEAKKLGGPVELIRQYNFPDDRFKHEGKGRDVLHWPMRNDHVAGPIVYE